MSSLPSVFASPIPAHIGVIMDGNGRWAQGKKLLRTQGHLEGLQSAKRIVKAAADMGVRYLTLYAFSTENWKRTADEVGFIMGLVKRYLKGELGFYRENRIRIRHAGDPAGLPPDIARELREAAEETRSFEGLQVILALNYGGRDEIIRAMRRLVRAGIHEEAITEEALGHCLDNPDIPDPDLIIRSAGEYRISNFLLWEGAYSEYYVSDKLWPDWTEEDFVAAVTTYQRRERRFGGVTHDKTHGSASDVPHRSTCGDKYHTIPAP
ncbi:MAG: di-trans,poly-cis-decaprenylcistransferase [Treponema sp.]|jgi:undecaprenyl diphosphate synthase|nr:di-trans,poly-cis-decaprenylcistransferase [Treponema sp.]